MARWQILFALAALFQRRGQSCHRSGAIGPCDLNRYDQVAAMATMAEDPIIRRGLASPCPTLFNVETSYVWNAIGTIRLEISQLSMGKSSNQKTKTGAMGRRMKWVWV